jgi:Protein of unknown function (DUF3887)
MTDLVQIATEMVNACARRDFAGAYAHADKMFSAGVTEYMLAETWAHVTRTAGDLKAIQSTRNYRHLLGPLRTVFVTCQFERMVVDVEISFNFNDKIMGLALLTPGFE